MTTKPQCAHRVVHTDPSELRTGPHLRALFSAEPEIIGLRTTVFASVRRSMLRASLAPDVLVAGGRLPLPKILAGTTEEEIRRASAIALALVEVAATPVAGFDQAFRLGQHADDEDAEISVYLLRSGIAVVRDETQYFLFQKAAADPALGATRLALSPEIGIFLVPEPASAHERLARQRLVADDQKRLLPIALGYAGQELTTAIDLVLPWQQDTSRKDRAA